MPHFEAAMILPRLKCKPLVLWTVGWLSTIIPFCFILVFFFFASWPNSSLQIRLAQACGRRLSCLGCCLYFWERIASILDTTKENSRYWKSQCKIKMSALLNFLWECVCVNLDATVAITFFSHWVHRKVNYPVWKIKKNWMWISPVGFLVRWSENLLHLISTYHI